MTFVQNRAQGKTSQRLHPSLIWMHSRSVRQCLSCLNTHKLMVLILFCGYSSLEMNRAYRVVSISAFTYVLMSVEYKRGNRTASRDVMKSALKIALMINQRKYTSRIWSMCEFKARNRNKVMTKCLKTIICSKAKSGNRL